MFSARTTSLAAVAAIAAVSLIPAAAQAGVVVSASGPSAASYPVGRKLGDDEKIVLRAGDTLTVLDSKGTRVLRGAGTYTLSQQTGPSKAGTFALLTRQRSAQRMRTGAVRAGDDGGPVSSPNLWYVDVRSSGPMCLPAADEVRLWRPTTEGAVSYAIRPAGSYAVVSVTFADGEMLAPWNAEALPVEDGASFEISQPDAAGHTITFKLFAEVPDKPEALADELIANGCTAQLAVLSSALMVAEE